MIEKFRRIQHSWAIKAILILTALSFMSLFGVSGYVNSAGANKTIVKVDGTKIGLNEVYSLFNRDVQMAQRLMGPSFELTEMVKNSILLGIVNRETNNLIIQKTAENNGIDVSDDFVRRIIQSQSQFFNENGVFSYPLFQRYLAMTYQNEESYIYNMLLDIKRQILVNNVVKNVAFPSFYEEYLLKAAGIKKVFEYVIIDSKEISVDRNISDEEVEQYYNDFATEFMAPETRDVNYVFIQMKKDYDENVEFLAEIEDTIGGGATLKEVAEKYDAKVKTAKKVNAIAPKGETAEFVDDAFSYDVNEISSVIETQNNGFAVLEVVKVYPEYQKDVKDVKKEIVKMWQANEQMAIAQEISSDVINDIDAGDSLADIAKRFSLKMKTTQPILKNDSFADLSINQMQDAFNTKKGSIKVYETPNAKILAVVKKVIKGEKADKKAIIGFEESLKEEASQAMINSYGKELDVRVKLQNLQ